MTQGGQPCKRYVLYCTQPTHWDLFKPVGPFYVGFNAVQALKEEKRGRAAQAMTSASGI